MTHRPDVDRLSMRFAQAKEAHDEHKANGDGFAVGEIDEGGCEFEQERGIIRRIEPVVKQQMNTKDEAAEDVHAHESKHAGAGFAVFQDRFS